MFDIAASFKTDDLKNELDVLRDSLVAKQGEFNNVYVELQATEGHLSNMEEKVSYVVAQLEQIKALTTPPPPSGAEIASDALDQYFTDPIFLASAGLAIGGVALVGLGGLAGLAGKLGKIAKGAPKVTAATKATKLTKATKIMKLGKGAVVLSGAIAIVDLVVNTASAQGINKELNKNKATLSKNINDANDFIADAKQARNDAKAHLMGLLKDAEVDHLIVETEEGLLNFDPAISAYLRQMNMAIAELGKQKASLRMMRKMILAGMDSATAAGIAGMDPAVADSLAKRVTVERMLVAGNSAIEAARKHDLAPEQVGAIANVVRARADVIAGEMPETVSEAFDVPLAIVLEEVAETMPLLVPHWDAIEGTADLTVVADAVVVPASGLERLRNELASKLLLASGGDISAIAKSAERSIEEVNDWNLDLAEARGRLAIMDRDGVLGGAPGLAAKLRLPLKLTTQSP